MCNKVHVQEVQGFYGSTRFEYVAIYYLSLKAGNRFDFIFSVQSLVAFPKLKRQVLSYDPPVSSPKDFTDGTLFYVNQEFSLMYVTLFLYLLNHINYGLCLLFEPSNLQIKISSKKSMVKQNVLPIHSLFSFVRSQ